MLQESALSAENAATVHRLMEEGRAKYQPLALATVYATSKKTQVGLLAAFYTDVKISSPDHQHMFSAALQRCGHLPQSWAISCAISTAHRL